MDALVLVKVGSSDIAIEGDRVEVRVFLSLYHVEAICNHIRVLHSPTQRLDLLDRDVPAQVMHLCLGVLAVRL